MVEPVHNQSFKGSTCQSLALHCPWYMYCDVYMNLGLSYDFSPVSQFLILVFCISHFTPSSHLVASVSASAIHATSFLWSFIEAMVRQPLPNPNMEDQEICNLASLASGGCLHHGNEAPSPFTELRGTLYRTLRRHSLPARTAQTMFRKGGVLYRGCDVLWSRDVSADWAFAVKTSVCIHPYQCWLNFNHCFDRRNHLRRMNTLVCL